MEYKEFVSKVTEALSERLDADTALSVEQFTKNNNTHYDGLILQRAGSNVAPAIQLLPFYHRHLDGASLDTICDDILNACRRHTPQSNIDVSCFTDFARAQEKIVMRLVSRTKNCGILAEVPHFNYLDLAVVFYCMLHADRKQQANILIRSEHLAAWGISEDELIALAKQNTPRLLPHKLFPMKELLDIGENVADFPPLYILTNCYRTNGATTLLYDGVLQTFAEQLQKDLIVLPSSIHEILLLPADDQDPAALSHYSEMVQDVNELQLPDDEILSDHAYYFRRETGLLSIPD